MADAPGLTHNTVAPHKRLEGGSHRWQNGVETEPGKPLITIITSTYNAASDLRWTIKSIREQSYPYVQWIIADGSSKDETIELLRDNENLIDAWFSEPDTGIYDAWNKALKYAKGEWVQFIGAGDELADPNTLNQIAPHLATAHPEYDIVYGKVAIISEAKRQLIEETGVPWKQLKKRWEGYIPKLPSHPGVFHHTSTFFIQPPFDASYRIAADSHFLLRQLKRKDFLYVPILVDRMPLGGISARTTSFRKTIQETRRAARELGFNPPISHIVLEKLKHAIKQTMNSILTEKGTRKAFDILRLTTGKKRKWEVE